MLKSIPNCVGWHWFKYADAESEARKGIVSGTAEVRQPLIDSMRELSQQAYSLRGLR
jgi:hypothetical protein